MSFDDEWADVVRRWCDPVFERADCGFEFNGTTFEDDGAGPVHSLLWEASPVRFVERYPDSDLADEVGEPGWPPPCADYWVYVDAPAAAAELSCEGWSLWLEPIPLSGDGEADGRVLATRFAEILRLSPPTAPGS